MDAYSCLDSQMQAALKEDQKKLDDLMDLESDWRSLAKDYEQYYMIVKDQYSQLAVAAGFEPVGLYGDVLEPHEVILDKVQDIAEKAWRYDELSS